MKKYIYFLSVSFLTASCLFSCKKYLDVVPDNIATLKHAFAMRNEAEKYLFTCYSYMPKTGDYNGTPAMLGGDEIWEIDVQQFQSIYKDLAKNQQNIVNPIGGGFWPNMYLALRDCNIFLENIEHVPDIMPYERQQWIAEAKFLKAYYHFWLVRMYGPIPLIKTNLPLGSTVEKVRVSRDPVDSCFNYIVQLLDEAKDHLPLQINDPLYYGKITKPIAYTLKAKVLAYAASPLFNGNTEQAGLINRDGTRLFSQTQSQEKWAVAAEACKRAINVCDSAGIKLFYHPANISQVTLSDTIRTQMSLRMAVTKPWNDEIIWANTQSWVDWTQRVGSPALQPAVQTRIWADQRYDAPLKIVESFYTKNGVPINEDKTWNYAQRYETKIGTPAYKLYIRSGYTTANMNFDREPRFYAYLGFDGGVWYGQGRWDDKNVGNLFYLQNRLGQENGKASEYQGPNTGYPVKKIVHPENAQSPTAYTVVPYPYPLLRLSDLYLLYAECANEANGPVGDALTYINLVRQRAGIPDVQVAWQTFSSNPTKYATKEGFRNIVHNERQNELCFEQQRFWDLRRWKTAIIEVNKPIQGWNVFGSSISDYYRVTNKFSQKFTLKDYFWPISENDLTINPNLVQNLGW